MRAGMHGALIAWFAVATAGCYLAHERTPPGDAGTDAIEVHDSPSPDAWSSMDSGLPDVWRTDAACSNHAFDINTPCTPELEARCQTFAAEEAVGRPVCRCTATRECDNTREVCVSDAPGGPHYCLAMCTPR